MKKLIKILMLIICLIPINSFAAGPKVNVVVNGNALVTDTPAVIMNNRTMIPFRAIFEALGVRDITWDPPTETVVGKNANITVKLVIGSYDMDVNGENVTMDVAPVIMNSRTMIPLSFVSESLGAKVSWDPKTYTASIVTDGNDFAQNNDSSQTISPAQNDNIIFGGETIGNDIRGYYAMEDLSRGKYVINFKDKGKAEMIEISGKNKVSGNYSYSNDKLKLNIGKFNASYTREDEKYNGLDIILMKDDKNPTSGLTFAITSIDKSEYDKYTKKDNK